MHFPFPAQALACCVLALSGSAASAQAPVSDTMSDYSHVMPLTVSGKDAVVQLRLPQAVYLNARSADLRDLRVFDAQGIRVPFTLRQPMAREETSRRTLPVKVFPVFDNEKKQGNAAGLDIRTSRDGSLLSVTTHGGPVHADDGAARLAALVLDLRQPGAGDAAAVVFDALSFSLPPGTGNYMARVALEVSDDLKQWDTVGYANLSWLVNSATQTLSNNRIEFQPHAFRYARLGWQEGTPLQFASISAESPLRTEATQALDHLALQPQPGKLGQDLVYQSALAIPVQRAGLQFAEQNIVMPGLLGHYVELPGRPGKPATSWEFEPAFSATFFRITQAGKLRSSGEVSMPAVHQAQWVLRPQVATASKPVLQVSWLPATLIFVANGKAPYTLAVGRDKARAGQSDLAQVAPGFSAAELQGLEQAVAGPVQAQHALAQNLSAAQAASASARARMALLWGVLLLGVGVLGVMAWRLFRQMR